MFEIAVLDYHVAGEPLRIVPAPVTLPGATMEARRAYAQAHLMDRARFIVAEPRGHADAFGAFLTAPVRSDSQFGALFFDGTSFKQACGHGAIALARAAIDHGWVPPETAEIRIDVPAGQVCLRILGEDIEYSHVASHVLALDVLLGGVLADIVMAGPPVVLIAHDHLSAADLPALRALFDQITAAPIILPDGQALTVDMVQFYADRDAAAYDTLTLFGAGAYDRSPCGTGTSARIAQLVARGRLAVGSEVEAVSLTGGRFAARAAAVDGPLVFPQVIAQAYPTGRATLIGHPGDPFPAGFALSSPPKGICLPPAS